MRKYGILITKIAFDSLLFIVILLYNILVNEDKIFESQVEGELFK